MKVLVLNKDLTERAIIQQVLQHNSHEIMSAEDSETAMQLLQEGDIRFIIADRANTDIDDQQFIKRVRDAKHSLLHLHPIAHPQSPGIGYYHASPGRRRLPAQTDVPLELKSRVSIGERIIRLRDNLSEAKDTARQHCDVRHADEGAEPKGVSRSIARLSWNAPAVDNLP